MAGEDGDGIDVAWASNLDNGFKRCGRLSPLQDFRAYLSCSFGASPRACLWQLLFGQIESPQCQVQTLKLLHIFVTFSRDSSFDLYHCILFTMAAYSSSLMPPSVAELADGMPSVPAPRKPELEQSTGETV